MWGYSTIIIGHLWVWFRQPSIIHLEDIIDRPMDKNISKICRRTDGLGGLRLEYIYDYRELAETIPTYVEREEVDIVPLFVPHSSPILRMDYFPKCQCPCTTSIYTVKHKSWAKPVRLTCQEILVTADT